MREIGAAEGKGWENREGGKGRRYATPDMTVGEPTRIDMGENIGRD